MGNRTGSILEKNSFYDETLASKFSKIITDMNFESKKTSLLILVVTSFVFSRFLFFLFNDPEGPNLLVVTGMAVIIFLLSFAVYVYYPATSFSGLKKLLLVIFVQILIVTGFYFLLS